VTLINISHGDAITVIMCQQVDQQRKKDRQERRIEKGEKAMEVENKTKIEKNRIV
jgi:hypothetical protein